MWMHQACPSFQAASLSSLSIETYILKNCLFRKILCSASSSLPYLAFPFQAYSCCSSSLGKKNNRMQVDAGIIWLWSNQRWIDQLHLETWTYITRFPESNCRPSIFGITWRCCFWGWLQQAFVGDTCFELNPPPVYGPCFWCKPLSAESVHILDVELLTSYVCGASAEYLLNLLSQIEHIHLQISIAIHISAAR